MTPLQEARAATNRSESTEGLVYRIDVDAERRLADEEIARLSERLTNECELRIRQVAFLESQNAECARGLDALAGQVAERDKRIGEMGKVDAENRAALMKLVEQWERVSDGCGDSLKIHCDRAARHVRNAMGYSLSTLTPKGEGR